MHELNMMEIDEVSGGWVKALVQSVAGSFLADGLQKGGRYLLENSYMGRGEFPPPPRAGRE